MGKFIIRRFLGLFPTIFIILTICFFLIRVAPGGPFDADKKLPPHILKNIEAKYHLDLPLYKQYQMYITGVIKGDFGPSLNYDNEVSYYIFNAFPASFILGVVALFISLVLGISVGTLAAVKQNTWVDYTSMTIAVIGISLPLFVIGPVLMYIFAMKLGILPTSGWITGRSGIITIIMPAVTLSSLYFANVARLTRASVLEQLQSGYVRTARAKGLSEFNIVWKHVLKGAMLPIVSYIGPAFADIITGGSIVVERIFRVPGLGEYFVQSSFNRDYPMIMGTVFIYAVVLLIMNFLVDIVYGFLDPRISYN